MDGGGGCESVQWKDEKGEKGNTDETLPVDKEVDDLAVLAGLVAHVLLDVVKEPWLLCSVFPRARHIHTQK